MDGLNQGFVDDFNWVEASVWLAVAACFYIHVLRHRRPLPKLALAAGLLFLLFGISDIVETRTGAWWRPWWLGVWKGSCIFGMFMAYGFFKPDPPDTRSSQMRIANAFIAAGGMALIAGLLAWWHGQRFWYLNDVDSYYHLALARLMRAEGAGIHSLEWTRFSVFGEHFADKEWLYHVLLMPFLGGDLLKGGHLAQVAIIALFSGLYAFVAVRLTGIKGILALPVLIAANPSFLLRLTVLRPHVFSLMVLLGAAYVIARGRIWALAALGVIYALTYTAWQTLLILCGATFAVRWWIDRKPTWGLLGFPAIGLLLGVLIHPSFPANLQIWKLQNILFFLVKDLYPGSFGQEIVPLSTSEMLSQNSVGLLLLGAALAGRRGWRLAAPLEKGETALLVFTVLTGWLYLQSARFAEYAVPLGVMAAWVFVGRLHPPEGKEPLLNQTIRRIWPFLLAGGLAWSLRSFNWATTEGLPASNALLHLQSPEEQKKFSALVPDGAPVAAFWGQAPYYMAIAPQGRYLNVLDPIFMMALDERLFEAERHLYDGSAADPAALVGGLFDSHYLAFDRRLSPVLYSRLERDPRFVKLYDSPTSALYRLVTAEKAGFITNWQASAIPQTPRWKNLELHPPLLWPTIQAPMPTSPYTGFNQFPPELAGQDCALATREAVYSENRKLRVGFGAAGPSRIIINGESRLLFEAGVGIQVDAVLFDMEYPAGMPVEMAVITCRSQDGHGFYWRETPAD